VEWRATLGAYPSIGVSLRCTTALIANIKLGWKCLKGHNTILEHS